MIAFLQGAVLSYRALFTWLNPLGYVSSRIIGPIGMAVAFISLAHYYGAAVERMLVGASLLAGAGAVLYGMALSVGNERSFGTLDIWLSSPQNKLGAVGQRALPHVVDGAIGGLCTYLVCGALYRALPLRLTDYLVVLALTVVTTACLGLTLAALAMVIEDLFIGPNVADLLLMTLTGTLIPYDRLPGALRTVADLLPLTHLMAAVNARLAGDTWPVGQLLLALGVAVLWGAAGSLFVTGAARRARTARAS